MNNRMHNCRNPYQGSALKVLCVCSAGLLRSPTAANVLQEEYSHNTRAVGLDQGHALIPIETVHLLWAEEIVCMNKRQKKDIQRMLDEVGYQDRAVLSLDIPDKYAYMDEELQRLILEQYVLKKEEHNASTLD